MYPGVGAFFSSGQTGLRRFAIGSKRGKDRSDHVFAIHNVYKQKKNKVRKKIKIKGKNSSKPISFVFGGDFLYAFAELKVKLGVFDSLPSAIARRHMDSELAEFRLIPRAGTRDARTASWFNLKNQTKLIRVVPPRRRGEPAR